MTLERLEDLACEHFNVTPFELRSKEKTIGITTAKHIFRAMAVNELNITRKNVATFHGITAATLVNSLKKIEDGQFEDEYSQFRRYTQLNDVQATEVVTSDTGIERVTNEAFDERFYKHPTRINERTGLPYFPAFHFITSLGSPEPRGLTKWRQDKGHFADHIMVRAQLIGSYVHDCVDRMTKSDVKINHEDIHKAFPDPKEAQRVKDCLLGFINFVTIEEPVFLSSEKMECGKDYGFTIDTRMLLKSDGYKHKWAGDYKTSKVANDDHRMQVEVMRRTLGDDRGIVIVLGNSTKKKYTATPIKVSDHDHWWFKFNAIKEVAYVEMLRRGTIKPREDNMPNNFSLKGLNFKRKL